MLKFMNKKTSEMTGSDMVKFTVFLTAALSAIAYGIMAIAWKWDDIADWFDQRIHPRNDEWEEMNLEEDELD